MKTKPGVIRAFFLLCGGELGRDRGGREHGRMTDREEDQAWNQCER